MIKAKISYDNSEPYFTYNNEKHYLSNIDHRGYDLTCFTNTGYFAGFILTTIEHDIDDYAILNVIE